MEVQQITYRIRLRPTKAQERLFLVFAGHCRFVFNELLGRSKAAYAAGEKFCLSPIGINYELAKIKAETPWLPECYSHTLQSAAKNLSAAYSQFFKKQGGFPRFKSKRTTRRSFSFPDNVAMVADMVKLPKIGCVRMVLSRDVVGEIKTATVTQSATGKWYVSLSCEAEIATRPPVYKTIGVDVGLIDYITTSDGESVAAPKHMRRSQKKLKRLQQPLSRKKKGSANRAKARKRVAIHYERVANQRKDFQHKLSTKLISENQAIGIETLSIKGLSRGRLSKSFNDAGFGEFFRQLEYKAKWYGRTIVKADRFYPSSKTCSCCGWINKALTLSERKWRCDSCDTHHDRDVNAAINLRTVALGYSETQNACGADVSRGEIHATC